MRHVLLPIDDEQVTHVDVQQFVTTGPGNAHAPSGYHLVRSRIPVPADDQLTRDVYLMVTALDRSGTYQGLREACKRVSAAFRLDEGSE